jgi:hypothetical protein
MRTPLHIAYSDFRGNDIGAMRARWCQGASLETYVAYARNKVMLFCIGDALALAPRLEF